MNYELLHFMHILEATVAEKNPENINKEELKIEIKQESLRIISVLKNAVCHLKPQRAKHYIAQHQHSLEVLLQETQIITANEATNEKENTPELTQISTLGIINILQDIKRFFPEYFNYESFLPEKQWQTEIENLNKQTNELIETLTTQQNGKEIIKFLESLLKSAFQPDKPLTYKQLSYWQIVLKELCYKLKQQNEKSTILELISILISLNLNHKDFFQFCCNYINTELQTCEEMSAQHKTLSLIRKSILQIYPLTNTHYDPGLIPIKQSLLKFVTSEMQYLQSMEHIANDLYQHSLLDSKYKVTFTVKQLAIFIHLQVTAKIIIPGSPKILHEYIAKHYSTSETSRISVKSFKNAYYSASTEDLEKVIDKLVTMLAIAQDKI